MTEKEKKKLVDLNASLASLKLPPYPPVAFNLYFTDLKKKGLVVTDK